MGIIRARKVGKTDDLVFLLKKLHHLRLVIYKNHVLQTVYLKDAIRR